MTRPRSPVFVGQFVAALAQAEWCDVLVADQRVELSARYEPSGGLAEAFHEARALVVGLLGWALPLERPSQFARGGCSVVQWRSRGLGSTGRWGRN